MISNEISPPLQRKHKPRARFIIGLDEHGCWVVNDRMGLVGGLFVSQDAAMHFAAEQTTDGLSAVRCMSKKKIDLELLSRPVSARRAISRHF